MILNLYSSDVRCEYLEHFQIFEPKELALDKSTLQLTVFFYYFNNVW